MANIPELSLIIPVYNEEETLEDLIKRVYDAEFKFDFEIIIVDDGSKDSSRDIERRLEEEYPNIRVLFNDVNLGKSQTVRRGVLESKGRFVVTQDADLEYEPAELQEMMDFIREDDLEAVYGNRFGKKNKVIYWQNYWGNKILSFVSNLFTYFRLGVWIPDMEVCYKLIRGDIFRSIAENLESTSNFGLEPETTARLSKFTIDGRHVQFGVVPISYYPRSNGTGKEDEGLEGWFEGFG
ncbi:glycosyltransferase [Candidatus Dojkabacteria bacterium]|nr:glycosyltransferase [Candidatus Dojkabacteria bacterium]